MIDVPNERGSPRPAPGAARGRGGPPGSLSFVWFVHLLSVCYVCVLIVL